MSVVESNRCDDSPRVSLYVYTHVKYNSNDVLSRVPCNFGFSRVSSLFELWGTVESSTSEYNEDNVYVLVCASHSARSSENFINKVKLCAPAVTMVIS